MSKQQEAAPSPNHKPGEIIHPEIFRCHKTSLNKTLAVCQTRKLIALVESYYGSPNSDLVFFRYFSTPSSSPSDSSYKFEKVGTLHIQSLEETPWDMVFGEHYLFLCGETENRIGVIDLDDVMMSHSATEQQQDDEEEGDENENEQKKKKNKIEIYYSSFDLQGASCDFNWRPVMTRSKLAFPALSHASGSNINFSGVVVLDITKFYKNNNINNSKSNSININNNKNKSKKEQGQHEDGVPKQNAFPTISAIMDKDDQEHQPLRAALSQTDDGARVAYLSKTCLKVCDVATKEKIFEVEIQTSRVHFYCLFHPTEENVLLLAGDNSAVRMFDVKAKTKIREVKLPSSFSSSESRLSDAFFPTLTAESRYLVLAMYDKGERKIENQRIDLIDLQNNNVDSNEEKKVVVQSTKVPLNGSLSCAFLSHNTLLCRESDNGPFLVKGIAISLWQSRKPVFLIREKSPSSNRIGNVLKHEWVVLRLCVRFVA